MEAVKNGVCRAVGAVGKPFSKFFYTANGIVAGVVLFSNYVIAMHSADLAMAILGPATAGLIGLGVLYGKAPSRKRIDLNMWGVGAGLLSMLYVLVSTHKVEEIVVNAAFALFSTVLVGLIGWAILVVQRDTAEA